MRKEKLKIQTKRLVLQPMTDQEVVELIESTNSDELREAYREMLDGCRRDPENRVWYAPWKMELKDSRKYIGDMDFKGPAQNHSVEVGYGILPEYEGNGYTTEALQAMVQWAFKQTDVVFVEAETDPENKASQRVLEKCGFVADGTGEEGPRFVLESTLTNWSMIDMCLGMSLGMAIGAQQNQMTFGMAIGISIGWCVGTLMYQSAKKEREKQRQERKM